MQILQWRDILENNNRLYFETPGTGISVGSFDGLHLGHRKLICELVEGCRKQNLVPGVLTFNRPLPSLKKNGNYPGDVSSLSQRLKLLESCGVEFVILSDFSENLSSLKGQDFFSILKNKINLKFIAEGVDFRCGYKGATTFVDIKKWADENSVGTVFVEPVFYNTGSGEERISSSYIRKLIQAGELDKVNYLLSRNYQLDLSVPSEITQILPPVGEYKVVTEKNTHEILKIDSEGIHVHSDAFFFDFCDIK